MTIRLTLQGGDNAANEFDGKRLQDLTQHLHVSDLLAIVEAHKKDPLTESEHDAISQANAVLDDEEGNVDLGDFCCYQLPALLGAISRFTKS